MTDEQQPVSLLDEFRAEAAAEAQKENPDQIKLPPTEVIWEGSPILRDHLVPIDELKDHDKNPREGDVAAISASLEHFGQVRPILFDPNLHTIVAGHHVRAAARLLGWTHVAAISNAFDNPKEAEMYLLTDNKVSFLGEMDSRKEYEMTLSLEEAGYGEFMEKTGYDIDARETLMELAGATPETEGREREYEAGESPEAAAARAAAIAQYEQHREVVLLLDFPEQYEAFSKDVRALMGAYGTTGTVATIVRAVGEAAALVNPLENPEQTPA